MGVAQLNGVTTRQRLQRVGQLAHLRHPRPVDQDRDHTNIASKCRCDFDSNEIVWIAKPAVALLVCDIEPVATDDRQKDIAGGNLAVEMIYKVDPGRKMVDIHEEIFSSETLSKPVMQP